jgi:putative phage-type endonuclease
VTLVARSAAWHADRRGGIGSSDASIITGDSPWGDLLTLYAVKAGIVDEPDTENNATAWGLRLEDVVAAWVTETTGRKLRRVNRRLRHKTHDWMHASLDREYVGEKRICEIKTRRYADDEWGPAGSSQIPAHYLVQVQHQLAVTGYPVADVAVLFAGSDPRLYTIERDEALIEALIELEGEFWAAVTNGTKPEALIRKQRPVVVFREGEITADETLARGIEGLWLLRQEIKGLKADEEAAAEAVKTILGPNTAARAGDYRATYRQNADSHPIRWELVASAYRKYIESLDPEWDADVIEGLFTDTKPGFRPLLIKKTEEATAAA